MRETRALIVRGHFVGRGMGGFGFLTCERLHAPTATWLIAFETRSNHLGGMATKGALLLVFTCGHLHQKGQCSTMGGKRNLGKLEEKRCWRLMARQTTSK